MTTHEIEILAQRAMVRAQARAAREALAASTRAVLRIFADLKVQS